MGNTNLFPVLQPENHESRVIHQSEEAQHQDQNLIFFSKFRYLSGRSGEHLL